MTRRSVALLSPSPDEPVRNPSKNPTLRSLLPARISRREVLRGSLGLFASRLFLPQLAGCTSPQVAPADGVPRLSFAAVPKSLLDRVSLPAGYTATVLYRLGDPLAAGVPAYQNDGSESGASFTQRAGDHHDGMHFFGLGPDGRYSPDESRRGLLAINHESATLSYLHKDGPTVFAGVRTIADEVIKEQHAHGVSIVEIERRDGRFVPKQDSRWNRRITAVTELLIAGPAARSPGLITAYSPDGSQARGTLNNCGSGATPWGTYLTCEENWAGYLRRIQSVDDPGRSDRERVALSRYGVGGEGGPLWATAKSDDPSDTRFRCFDATRTGASADGSDDFRNVMNTFGWVVEIDPFDPGSTPKKRTALGRFAHEAAALGRVVPGQPLVWYMGDDARNEYVYKFVSAAGWNPADQGRGTAAGDTYLDRGTLYVARFLPDGSGVWLSLRHGQNGIGTGSRNYPFSDDADVLIHARLAADIAGATRLDRPEWSTVNPRNGEVYFTLTNNALRTRAAADAANPRSYNDRKFGSVSQRGNPNGHILRLREDGDRGDAERFRWDIFLFGARASADPYNVNLSRLSDDNDFSSPDGLRFSTSGLLWIETDDSAMGDVSNCMLLAAVPGQVGDGGPASITNLDAQASSVTDTWVGAPASAATLRRFLVGPRECEITGLTETPDGRALFVNIQHPGEATPPDLRDPRTFGSHWPDGGSARPRSATIVITRDDGGVVGGGVGGGGV
jgi:hypothetical protein